MARGTKMTKKLTGYICEQLEKGRTLTDICREDGMPQYRTVLKWVREDEEFCEQYRISRESQMSYWVDEMNDIADMPPPIAPDEAKNAKGETVILSDSDKKLWVNAENQRRRLKVDAIKFLSAKIAGTFNYHQNTGVTVQGDTINIINYASAPPPDTDSIDIEANVKEVNFIDTTEHEQK